MLRTILIVIFVVLAGIEFWYAAYRMGKKDDYDGDERWQAIKAKVKTVVYIYVICLSIPVIIGLVATSFIDEPIYVNLEHILWIAVAMLGIRIPVELIAFKYYDKKMQPKYEGQIVVLLGEMRYNQHETTQRDED